MVNWSKEDEYNEGNSFSNLATAALTTSYARKFSPSFGRKRFLEMDVHNLTLEGDWFVLGSQRLIKQLTFYSTANHMPLLLRLPFS